MSSSNTQKGHLEQEMLSVIVEEIVKKMLDLYQKQKATNIKSENNDDNYDEVMLTNMEKNFKDTCY